MLKISDLGERKVIEKIIAFLDKPLKKDVLVGDDVSAISIDQNLLAVLKTDMLVGETDIPPGMTLQQAARKAVVMTVSDLAAKGVKPLAFLTALGLPRSMTEKDVEALARGLNDGVREYGTYLVGGDTGESSSLVICCMAFGISHAKMLISRSGARPGDVLAVTGTFGRPAAGLKILLEGITTSANEKGILEAVFMPKARLKEGLELSKTGVISASIDSSDGLAVSLHELRKMSHVGFELTKLPIAREVVGFAIRNKLKASELALYGGEEYELVVTVKPDGWNAAQHAVQKVGCKLIAIGKVTETQNIIFRKNNIDTEIQNRGWEHFR